MAGVGEAPSGTTTAPAPAAGATRLCPVPRTAPIARSPNPATRSQPAGSEVPTPYRTAVTASAAAIASAPRRNSGVTRRRSRGKDTAPARPSQPATAVICTTPTRANGTAGAMPEA